MFLTGGRVHDLSGAASLCACKMGLSGSQGAIPLDLESQLTYHERDLTL